MQGLRQNKYIVFTVHLMMKSEHQTVNGKVLLCEPLDQGLEDGQLVLDARGHDGEHWVSRVLHCLLVC